MKRFIRLMTILLATFASVTVIFAAKQPPRPPELQYFECGRAGDACEVDGRSYNIVAPEGEGPFPVVIVFHGSGRSGDRYVQRKDLVHPIIQRGYAFVAPTGMDIEYNNGPGTGWLASGSNETRDDFAFVVAMLDDLAKRFPIDETRILVSGSSNGAIFSWYLACADVDPRLTHFAPHGGTPYSKRPYACLDSALDFKMLHGHGRKDPVVPVTGTASESGSWTFTGVKGVSYGFAKKAACGSLNKKSSAYFDTEIWSDCKSDGQFGFALHDGGHGVHPAWFGLAIDWFEGDF
jgi:polyhydroxybutyrate depolymerase